MEEILEIKQLLEEDRPVGWDSLPDIDLYMDQVVSYLPRQTVGGKAPTITSAMINNYVKDGLLPRACGKRYHKEHLGYLTAIGLLKNVLTVKDMKLLLGNIAIEGEEERQYGRFLQMVDEAFSGVNQRIDENMPEEDLATAAMHMALVSCAAKTVCEHLLGVIQEKFPEEDPKVKKEKEKEAAKKAKAEQKAKEKAENE